ncbi:hypothetical protein [Actinokineospora iranica]|uniref:Homeodomain-like domain-containing protein n=1 Tax=Actinokineospora iranica TaxID=1271860 RepID=A0A1G6K2B3_9PSEU|nr:hypothetical protein [Actinokineospora iranica]SDC25087.1 hypothetical protein SAMN05216174_101677 [Actinokineospora iranica]
MTGYTQADARAAWRAVRGEVLGEELSTAARELAVAALYSQRRTDAEIAAVLRLSTYTTARIRERLRLRARHPDAATVSASVHTGGRHS